MIFLILILKWSSNHDSKTGQSSSTVSLCWSGFIIGGLLGMIIGLIFWKPRSRPNTFVGLKK